MSKKLSIAPCSFDELDDRNKETIWKELKRLNLIENAQKLSKQTTKSKIKKAFVVKALFNYWCSSGLYSNNVPPSIETTMPHNNNNNNNDITNNQNNSAPPLPPSANIQHPLPLIPDFSSGHSANNVSDRKEPEDTRKSTKLGFLLYEIDPDETAAIPTSQLKTLSSYIFSRRYVAYPPLSDKEEEDADNVVAIDNSFDAVSMMDLINKTKILSHHKVAALQSKSYAGKAGVKGAENKLNKYKYKQSKPYQQLDDDQKRQWFTNSVQSIGAKMLTAANKGGCSLLLLANDSTRLANLYAANAPERKLKAGKLCAAVGPISHQKYCNHISKLDTYFQDTSAQCINDIVNNMPSNVFTKMKRLQKRLDKGEINQDQYVREMGLLVASQNNNDTNNDDDDEEDDDDEPNLNTNQRVAVTNNYENLEDID